MYLVHYGYSIQMNNTSEIPARTCVGLLFFFFPHCFLFLFLENPHSLLKNVAIYVANSTTKHNKSFEKERRIWARKDKLWGGIHRAKARSIDQL